MAWRSGASPGESGMSWSVTRHSSKLGEPLSAAFVDRLEPDETDKET